MRPVIALTFALLAPVALPAAAWACPPPPPGYVPPTHEARLRERVNAADAIIYARVERSIGHGAYDEERDAFSGDPGMVRVVHAYKGNLRAGQRLRMYGASDEGTSCSEPFHYETSAGRTGRAGLLFLYRNHLDRPQPFPFYEFIPQAEADEMIRLGLIRSAQAQAAERR